MTRWIRVAGSIVLGSGAIALAGCGSSSPKVSSADFISKCTSNSQIRAAVKGNTTKLDGLCKCVQQKLVAGGFGDRKLDDQRADVATASRQAGVACAIQVLSGG